MSSVCGDCSCSASDKSNCGKKGYAPEIIETEKSIVVDVPSVAEHDGCNCGSNCKCTNCKCGK